MELYPEDTKYSRHSDEDESSEDERRRKSRKRKKTKRYAKKGPSIHTIIWFITERTRVEWFLTQWFRQDWGNWVCKQKTGCVKCWLATLAILSFWFLPHLQPKKHLFSPFIIYWATFLAQLVFLAQLLKKHLKMVKKNLNNFRKPKNKKIKILPVYIRNWPCYTAGCLNPWFLCLCVCCVACSFIVSSCSSIFKLQ